MTMKALTNQSHDYSYVNDSWMMLADFKVSGLDGDSNPDLCDADIDLYTWISCIINIKNQSSWMLIT